MTDKDSKQKLLSGLILFGIFLRYLSAFLSLGASHPNEFYRLLEPIASFEGYSTRLPWEWREGLLSVLPVEAVYGVIQFLRALGVHSPLTQLILLKMVYASLSLLLIWSTWRLVKKFAPGQELYAATFVSLWPEFIYQSVRLMDYSVEAALFAGSVGLTLAAPSQKRWAWCLAGALLGLAFFARFQSGLDWVALVLASLFLFQYKKRALEFVFFLFTGYVGVIFLLGLLESSLSQRPLLDPFFKYISFNWSMDGAAKFYGSAPWHRFFSESAKYYGIFPFLVFSIATLWRAFKDRVFLPLAMIYYFPFLVYSLISHKEGRFAYGFLWLAAPLGFVALSRLLTQKKMAVVLLAVVLIGGLIDLSRVSRVYLQGSSTLREWVLQSARAEGLSEAIQGQPKLIEGDPDFLPGGFFLRHRGRLCYRFSREGKPAQEGDCSTF